MPKPPLTEPQVAVVPEIGREKLKRPPRIGGKETAAMHRLLKLLEPFDQMARHRILAFVNSYAEELPVPSKLPLADSDDLGF